MAAIGITRSRNLGISTNYAAALNRIDFFYSAFVTAAFKRGRKEYLEPLFCVFESGESATENYDVCIVVLARKAGVVGICDECRADPFETVGSDRNPYSGTADKKTEFCAFFENVVRYSLAKSG
jgi:hypothetical protein